MREQVDDAYDFASRLLLQVQWSANYYNYYNYNTMTMPSRINHNHLNSMISRIDFNDFA